MDDNNENKEVKEIVETVEVEPSKEEETETVETEPESSQVETEVDDTETEEQPVEEEKNQLGGQVEIKDVEGESLRERAQRLEVTRLKRELAKHRKEDLFTPQKISQPVKSVLENYDPEQIKDLKAILSATADELGFVKKDDLYSTINAEKRDDIWDSFLDKHPEYLSENDPEGSFYNLLKEQFDLFKEPTTGKDFQKLLNRAHDFIFNTKSATLNINKINAQQEKIKVASHSGGTAGGKVKSPKTIGAGLRIDALKGFTEEEKSELFAE